MHRFYNHNGPNIGPGLSNVHTLPGVVGDYANFIAYLADVDNPHGVWAVLDALRTTGPQFTYRVRLDFPALETAPTQLFDSPAGLREWATSPERYGHQSQQTWDVLFDPNSKDNLCLQIVRINDAADPGAPSFMATRPGRVWGYLGHKVANCIIKQMFERVAYYHISGEKRPYMWDEAGERKGLSKSEPGHCSLSMKRLFKDMTYRTTKLGCEKYLAAKGQDHTKPFGFEPRDLCELAEMCECRIMIFVSSANYRTCRWDTADLVRSDKTFEGYTFCFNMTCDQHAEILPPETMRDEFNNLRGIPGKHASIVFLSDAEFEDALYREGDKPEDERRLYLIRKRATGAKFMPPNGVDAKGHKYAGWVLQSGDTFYKHRCLTDWTRDLIDEGMPAHKAALVICAYDVEYNDLMRLYGKRNVSPIYQRNYPSLHLAAANADKQFGHMQLPMEDGDQMYEYDGRNWYLTDFSNLEDFPYFHGVPMAHVWNEYQAPGGNLRFAAGGFSSVKVMIGNERGDEAFTFTKDKYAIFQVEELDLSGCTENTRAHLRRDGLFVDFDASRQVLFLPSPIVQLLQDHGVVWRASRLWVCYGCAEHWLPEDDTTEQRERMRADKTYAMVLGKLMSGRKGALQSVYVAPDAHTASSLAYWYSRQFAHGRLAGDREDPETIYQGEEAVCNSDSDLRPDCDPERIIYGAEGEFCGVTEQCGSSIVSGWVDQPKEATSTHWVYTFQDDYEWKSTYSHISGAQHAYCFVRLYQAVLRLPADEVVGFSLDAFRTRSDVTSKLGSLVSEEWAEGTFKPVEIKPFKAPYARAAPMLSDLYTDRRHLRGINAPSGDTPAWNAYKDGLSAINIVTGPAGSGKTTRHLQKTGSGKDDYRLPSSCLYVTMTNHLAHHVRSTMGVSALTSFKGFNRKVDEKGAVSAPRDRFDKVNSSNFRPINGLHKCHSVLIDEVSMIPADKVKDAIAVCKEHWCQVFITGDFDRERFYQLSPVQQGDYTLFDVLRETEEETQLTWVEPMRVFRQRGDVAFTELLQSMRHLDESESWKTLSGSDIVRHMDYSEMLQEFDPAKDLFVHPWHRAIKNVSGELFDKMGPGDKLKVRGNFSAPRMLSERDCGIMHRMKMNEGDKTVYKGSVCLATKAELQEVMHTKPMIEGLYSPTHEINPMLGATTFNLQGLTMPEDGTLYIYVHTPNCMEWVDEKQPKVAYVAASRARSASKLVIVTVERPSQRPRTS